jgi:hypothetical protein
MGNKPASIENPEFPPRNYADEFVSPSHPLELRRALWGVNACRNSRTEEATAEQPVAVRVELAEGVEDDEVGGGRGARPVARSRGASQRNNSDQV